MKRIFVLLSVMGLLFQVSCVTRSDDDPTPPESDPISSMPHNIPQSWEGTAGMPGGGMGQSF